MRVCGLPATSPWKSRLRGPREIHRVDGVRCPKFDLLFVAGELPEWMNPGARRRLGLGRAAPPAVRTAPNNRARRAASADDDDAVPAALDRV